MYGFPYKTVMRLNLPAEEPEGIDENIIHYNGPDILNEWERSRKIFITVSLAGDVQEDKETMNYVRLEAQRVKHFYDTTHIIKVHFLEEATYGQFVELVNMMSIGMHKRYMFYQDDFYILGEAPPEPVDSSLVIKPLDM